MDRGNPTADRHQRHRHLRDAQPRDGAFNGATVNGAAPKLTAADEMQLVSSSSQVLATPSAPNAAANGFNDCTYATACGAP